MALILPITKEHEKRNKSINRIQAHLAQTPLQHLHLVYLINQQLLQPAMALSSTLSRSKYDSNMTMIRSSSPTATHSLTLIKSVSSTKYALLRIKTRYVKRCCAGPWPAMMSICSSLQISCLIPSILRYGSLSYWRQGYTRARLTHLGWWTVLLTVSWATTSMPNSYAILSCSKSCRCSTLTASSLVTTVVLWWDKI